MAKRFVVKTTKEYTYDEKGFIVKEIVTEESYEEEINISRITTEDFIKKAIGVPNTSKVTTPPYTTTVSYDTVKADSTNGNSCPF